MLAYDWTKASETWAKEVFHNPNSKTPNAQQRIVLQAVHERRVNEFHDRHKLESHSLNLQTHYYTSFMVYQVQAKVNY